MGQYTDFLEDKCCSIFEEEDYLEEMKKAEAYFRTFDRALDTFLVAHGFEGDVDSGDEKVQFLTDRLKAEGIPVPRNLRKWYSEHRTIERRTAFQICFAFRLSVEELVSYLNENTHKFGYNNVAAGAFIQLLWREIAEKNGAAGQDGIAVRERKLLYAPFDREEDAEGGEAAWAAGEKREIDREAGEWAEGTAEREGKREKEGGGKREGERKKGRKGEEKEAGKAQTLEIKTGKRKERSRADDSLWEIYLQILGLSGSYAGDFYRGRSLKFLLRDNELLHPLAEASFPDRDGLNKILNGEHVSYERVRKLLILLVFYRFWAGKALERGGYEAREQDGERCIAVLDNYLTDAGYPALYPGNPYDFIILASLHSELPLVAFRDYMRELFFEKMEGSAMDWSGE